MTEDYQSSQGEENGKKSGPKLLLVFAFVTISLASGLVYGWPALRRMLVEEGSAMTEKQFGAIFTVGSWCTQGGRFLTGIARDSRLCGTRITAAICIFATALGCTGLAFAGKDDQLSLSVSFFLVGIGSGAQLCLQPVAGLFDKTVQGTILASMSGAFQISGLVFLCLAQITSNRKISLGIFALCVLMVALIALKLLPRFHFTPKKVGVRLDEEEQDEATDMGTKTKYLAVVKDSVKLEVFQPIEIEKATNVESEIEKAANAESEEAQIIPKEKIDDDSNGDGVMKLIKSTEYILLVLWFSVLLIPLQYYVATIGFQLERKGDDGRYTSLFLVLYASSTIFAPLLGKFADKFGVGAGQAIATILTGSSLLFLSSDSLSLGAHVIGMSFYGVGRMIVFGLFFTNVGKRFGYDHYGTLAGLGLLVSSLFGNIQYPLIALAADGYEQEVNTACGVVMLIQGLPYCFWLSRQERRCDSV